MQTVQEQIDSLNSDQKQVALEMGNCLAIAAPGSGKTKTLAVKAAYLLDRGHTVTAVTFTRDSALELLDRIASMIKPDLRRNLLVGTFHSINRLMAFPNMKKSELGQNILSKGESKLTKQWVVVKESQRRLFIVRAIEESKLDLDIDEASGIIESQKSGHLKPASPEHEVLQKTYQDLLGRHGLIDFQDILLETNKGIERKQITTLQTDYLMIDEFQDTDVIQFKWIMYHAYAGVKLTAVGDDDQSIYGFRRALGYKGMTEFTDRLQATQIILGMNYRSHREVLEPSSKLIDHNQDRMEKDLISFKGDGGSAYWQKFGSRLQEAEAVHAWSKAALDKGQTVGILARTNKRLDEIEAQFRRDQTPYVRGDGTSIIHSAEIGALMATLGMLVRHNKMDLDIVLGWCKVSEEEISGIHKSIPDENIYRCDPVALKKMPLSTDARTTYTYILSLIGLWKNGLKASSVDLVLEGAHEFLQQYAGKRSNRSLGTLKTVIEIFRMPEEYEGSGLQFIDGKIKEIEAAQRAMKSGEADTGEICASLSTAHSSKGLEYDNVWIIGAEKDSFPDEKASVQEERRLFFVAMTRARKNLVISASGPKPLSEFVDEAKLMRMPDVQLAD